MNFQGAKMRFALFVSTISISILSATVINVPDDHSTIQGGIDASNNGDTVLVAQGIYFENLILEKEIVLASNAIYDDLETEWVNNENIHETIISGTNTPTNPKKGSCIQVSFGNIQPTILGFTLQDGIGTSMLLTDCDIVRSERSGGAIMAYQAYPTIMYNRFINNGTSQVGGGNATQSIANGGAMTLYDDDDVEFDEDRDYRDHQTSSNRDIPEILNIQNNYFDNNSSGNGENFYSHGYAGSINVSGSVFEDINCEDSSVNEFVLHSVEEEAEYVMEGISGGCIEEDTYYVSSDDGNDNNPGTETEPLLTIRHALSLVKRGSETTTNIYLAAGVYSGDRNGEVFPIVMPDNVHLIGDEAETTTLAANADEDNEAVVMIIPECENVRVANMTLKNGYSEGLGCTGGGGLLITADDIYDMNQPPKTSTPIIENLIIENNHSHNGGGLSFFNVDGPTVSNVKIRNNQCTFQGGGVYSYVSNVTLSDIEVTNNQSLGYDDAGGLGNGGGMMLIATGGVFTNLTISDNISPSFGGGIWASGESMISTYNSFPEWSIAHSTISGNTATYGGGVALAEWGDQNPSLSNITISNNSTNMSGGGVWTLYSNPLFTDCAITGNSSGNSSGGLLAWTGSWPILTNCLISENSAPGLGGGMLLDGDGATLTRVAVVDNNSESYVGGIAIDGISVTLENVTVSGNTCSGGFFGDGGAIGIDNFGHAEITNSIIWGNDGDEVWLYEGTANITYSDVQGAWDGEGNINENPNFLDTNNGEYTLQAGSPCIDAGTADTDGDGQEDITEYIGSAPDMGAFETTLAAPTGFAIYPSETYVALTWDSVTGDNFNYFILERSTNIEFTDDIQSEALITNYFEDDGLEYDTEYFYRLYYVLDGDNSEYSDILSVTLEWMSVDRGQLPEAYALHPNFPNPFNPSTTIRFEVPDNAYTQLIIYNLLGEKVNTLINGRLMPGHYSTKWNGTSKQGELMPGGVYFYELSGSQNTIIGKMVLLK